MQFSRYSQEDKVLVYKKAKRVFDNNVERDRVGQCPLYRSKFWQRRERDKRNIDKRYNWYKRGGHETVMFVEATPNEQLAKAYRKALREASLKIRVVERAGKSMKKMLTKSDPFPEGKCSQNKCKMCKLDSNTNCKGRGVAYQIKFQGRTESSIRDGLYVGEMARSIGERVNEHLAKYEIKDKNSIFQKHIEEKHKGERQDVKVKVVSSCGNDAVLRQVTEAILIKELNPELNTKDEWENSNALSERDRIRRDNLPNFFKEDIMRTRNSNNSH